jgi:glutamine synthetase
VECIVADLAGIARGKAMPASKFASQTHFYLPNSIFFQTITGDWATRPSDDGFTEPDMILTPDFPPEPRALDRGLDAAGDPRHRGPAGQPVPLAPRNVLKRVVQLFNDKGWTPIVAPEMEFYLVAPQHRPRTSPSSPPWAAPAGAPPRGRPIP